MTIKKRKLQQLIITYAIVTACGKKRSNDMELPSFDSRMSNQRRAEILDVWSTLISKDTLATKFPLRLDREYHTFGTSKPRVTCQLCMFNVREMEDIMIRTEKKKLESVLI